MAKLFCKITQLQSDRDGVVGGNGWNTGLLHVAEFSVLNSAALTVGQGQHGCLGKSFPPGSNGFGFRDFGDAFGETNVKFMSLRSEPCL